MENPRRTAQFSGGSLSSADTTLESMRLGYVPPVEQEPPGVLGAGRLMAARLTESLALPATAPNASRGVVQLRN